jgi:hypothetical protein
VPVAALEGDVPVAVLEGWTGQQGVAQRQGVLGFCPVFRVFQVLSKRVVSVCARNCSGRDFGNVSGVGGRAGRPSRGVAGLPQQSPSRRDGICQQCVWA